MIKKGQKSHSVILSPEEDSRGAGGMDDEEAREGDGEVDLRIPIPEEDEDEEADPVHVRLRVNGPNVGLRGRRVRVSLPGGEVEEEETDEGARPWLRFRIP